jgi:prophage antirepressor-like protein
MGAVLNFAFDEHLVRVVEREGDPWFVANDVCRALGLANARKAVADLDEDEKGVTTGDTLGGEQAMNIVSEPGVYRLVFRSRKPEAERFKRWLAHDVLPQIRHTGSYRRSSAEAEPLPTLDNSSVAVWRAKIDLVREARIQFGAARARLLWADLGLPEVPALPISEKRPGEGPECLSRILAAPLDDATVQDAILSAIGGEAQAVAALLDFGIRLAEHTNGFWLSNNSPAVQSVFAGTHWRDGSWLAAIRDLPGAAAHTKVRFGAGGHQSRATWLPFDLLSRA